MAFFLWIRLMNRCGKTPKFPGEPRKNRDFWGSFPKRAVEKAVENGENLCGISAWRRKLWKNYVYLPHILRLFLHFVESNEKPEKSMEKILVFSRF